MSTTILLPIADNLTNILFQTETVQGKDAQNITVEFDDSKNRGGLLISMIRGMWNSGTSGRVVLLDSDCYVIQGIVALIKKGV